MPRVGGIYQLPHDDVDPDTTIESVVYNSFTRDVELDLNTPRPIIAGGTGASSVDGALVNLQAEKANQIVDNFDTHVWIAGSFASTNAAPSSPVAGHAFSGVVYVADASNVIVEARDRNDTTVPGRRYVREKKAGVWSAWVMEDANSKVAKAGDTMSGQLRMSYVSPMISLSSNAEQNKIVRGATLDVGRWDLYLANNVPETGANAGSDFQLVHRDDAGASLGNALYAPRSTGLLQVKGDPTAALGIATKQYVDNKVAGVGFPVNTSMAFFQAAAPTGWTKQIAAHDYAIRIVNTTGGGTSGSVPFSSLFARTAVDNHTLTIGEIPAHNHSILGFSTQGTNDKMLRLGQSNTANQNTELAGGGGAHTHNIDMRVRYMDCIICNKN